MYVLLCFTYISIHDEMTFPEAVVAIVNTPQFSRLKKIRQNGNCFHVFPNANHTRFEHSLGNGDYAYTYVYEAYEI